MPVIVDACPLCGFAGPFRVYNAAPVACHDYETMPAGSRLDQCPACQLIFLNPQPTANESIAYEAADEKWYPTENIPQHDWDYHIQHCQDILQFISRFQPLSGRFLDIGSNRGFLLDAASKAGYEAHGIEPTTRTAEFSRRQFQADVFIGTVEESPYETTSFDTITMWHVLEHVPSLRPFLCATANLLKLGGFLFLQIPYLDYWPRPVHINYLGSDLLFRLLREVGLALVTAELNRNNWLTVAAVRVEAEMLPDDREMRHWNALVSQALICNDNTSLSLSIMEDRLARRLDERLKQQVDGIYEAMANRPSSRLARAVRRRFSWLPRL